MLAHQVNRDIARSWLSNYTYLLERPVTMKAFALMIGYDTFGMLSTALRGRDGNELILDKIKDGDDKLLIDSFEISITLQKRHIELVDLFLCLYLAKKINLIDFEEFKLTGVSDISLNNKAVVEELLLSGEFDIKYTPLEVQFCLSNFYNSLTFRSLLRLTPTESQISRLPSPVFNKVFLVTMDALVDSSVPINSDVTKFVLKKAVYDGVISYEKIADSIAESKRHYFRESIREELSECSSKSEKVTLVRVWLDDSSVIDDKACMDFFKEHCVPQKATINERLSEHDYLLGYRQRGKELPNINKLLISKSLLSSPVLASYLLYNLASTGFSTERFYAILYVIGRLDILKPLIDKIEPMIRIDQEKSYSTREVNNELVANFLLMNKVGRIAEDKNDYVNFVESLLDAGHLPLVIGESRRMIEYVKLSSPHTLISRTIYNAVQQASVSDFGLMDTGILQAACILLERGGYDTSKLKPYINIKDYEIYSMLRFESVSKYFNGGHSDSLNNAVQTLLPHRDMHNLHHIVSCLRSILDIITVNSLKIEKTDVELQYPENTMVCKSFELHRYGRSGEVAVLGDGFPKKMAKTINAISGDSSGLLSMSDAALGIYICHEKLVNAKCFIKPEDYHIVYKDGEMWFLGELVLREAADLAFKYKPHTLHFLSAVSISGGVYRNFKEHYCCNMNVHVSKSTVSGIEAKFYDDYSSFQRLRSELNIKQYAGHNPFVKVIEKLLPKFYYGDECMNPNGKDYAGI